MGGRGDPRQPLRAAGRDGTLPEPQQPRGDGGSDPEVPVAPDPAARRDLEGAADASADALRLLLDDSVEDLYEHAPCGYLSLLLDGTVVKVNRTLLDWLHLDRTDLVGRARFPDLLTVGGRLFYETHLAPMFRLQGGIREIALDLVSADGRTLPVLVNGAVRTDAFGRPVVVRVMVLDATERTAYERELLAARQAAERSEARVRALQQVAGDLAAAGSVAEVAQVAVGAGERVLGAARAELWLLHPESREPALSVVSPAAAAAADAAVPAAADPAAGAAAPAEAPPRLQEALTGGEPVLVPVPQLVGDRVDEVVLPLLVDGGRLGALRLLLDPGRPLLRSERNALGTLAGQVALALGRARLQEQALEAGARAALLARLGRDLDEARGVAARARGLVALAVDELAERACVLLPSDGGGWTAAATSRRDRRPGGEAERLPDDWVRAAERAVETDSPQVLPGGAPGAGSATGVALPLRARGGALGVLVLVRERTPFWPGELVFLVDVADRAGLALENARLYEQERDVARRLQRSLLPERLPADPRVEIRPEYRSAVATLDVGGDWYDAFEVRPGVVAVSVGDVVGRGLAAAAAMGQLRSAVRALAPGAEGPAELLSRLDGFVEHAEAARMATLAYAELDLVTGQVSYACAGHPPPLLLAGQVPAHLLWGGRSAPLGARCGSGRREQAQVALEPGARLLLYTDGLVERRRRPLAEGLDALVRHAQRFRDAPLDELAPGLTDALLADGGATDDVCVLAVAWAAPALRVAIPARLERLRGLRADLRAWLDRAGVVGEDADALVLAASEAAANAVEHGCGGDPEAVVTVTASRHVPPSVEIRVADPGRWPADGSAAAPPVPLPPALPGPPPGAERGRGLVLMRALADSIDVYRRDGTEVVLRRRLRTGTDER